MSRCASQQGQFQDLGEGCPNFYKGHSLVYPSIHCGPDEPITEQPVECRGIAKFKDVCLNIPQSILNSPSGLENLAMTSEILIEQKDEILEVSPGIKTRSKFTVKNSLGQKLYYPVEDSTFSNHYCGALRASDMIILDSSRKEVMHFHRPLSCDCVCLSCLPTMTVSAPHGILLGTVEQELSILSYPFVVKNAFGDVVLRIVGPCSPCLLSMFGDVDFQIRSKNGLVPVGKITKEWSLPCNSAYNFRITFPVDLDVSIKAVVLGACFLIDAIFFESYE